MNGTIKSILKSIDRVEGKISSFFSKKVYLPRDIFEQLREVQLYYPIRLSENLLRVFQIEPSEEDLQKEANRAEEELRKQNQIAQDIQTRSNRQALKKNHQSNVYSFLEPRRKMQKVDNVGSQ